MKNNPLLKLQQFGQSIWLDYLHRRMFDTGELSRLIDEDGLRGVTSNPSIFQKAIGESEVYDDDIAHLARAGKSTEEIYQTLIVADVQQAADLFRRLYDASEGQHGFVSLEVNPHLAHDTQRTIEEARHYWQLLARPNVFIKVPATEAGLPAIRQLISEGINVNVTLLFGLPRYHKVFSAYLEGIAERLDQGKPVNRVSSVASFFLSRIDVLVDGILEQKEKKGGLEAHTAEALKGQVAIASAKSAYGIYKEICAEGSFKKMAGKGAHPQRLLWASTSSKNPDYSELKYVEPLIGADTVNTLPLETLRAYRQHGDPADRLEKELDRAGEILKDLADLKIDIDAVTKQLEDEGVDKFIKPYEQLMTSIEQRRSQVVS
jgi:transaldolase